MNPVFLSDSVYFHIGTSSATTGAATNADSTPVVSVEEDGTLMGYAPTVTNITTGLYRVQVDATAGNGFEAGKRYSLYVVATVGGVTGRDGVGEFEVLAVDLNTGVASVSGLTAANLDVAVSTRAAAGDNMGLSAGGVASVWAAVLESGLTATELIRLIAAAVQGNATGLESGTPAFKSIDGLTTRIDGTYAAGVRTITTRDAT